jgi:hypothetical protein
VQQVRSAARGVAEVIHKYQDELLLIYQNSHLLDRRSRRVILARVEGFVRMFEALIQEATKKAGIRIADASCSEHLHAPADDDCTAALVVRS